ncbi:MAG TPA: hypothetical protein VG325_00615 [Solirubrobacteraceae bacterium]|nr:hypothetical protein [Solirubrobacteraceae bacterium]
MSRRARRSPHGCCRRGPVLLLVLATLVGWGAASHPRAARAAASTKHKHQKPTTKTTARVPQGFVGMDVDGPLMTAGTGVNLNSQVGAMVADGVESVRVGFSWAAAQPYASAADVPAGQSGQYTEAGGVPTDFRSTDQVVGTAARRRLSVLPTVIYAPSWDAQPNPNQDGGFPLLRQDAPYAAYLTALIGRYGPHGSFWSQNPGLPKMPIRAWQIWNEPNLGRYWQQPFASSYVSLLRAAHTAVKRADPGARVVLGALTNAAWRSLAAVYRVRGARALFDVVSVNVFTKLPKHVMLGLRYVRSTMRRYGDGAKPMLATEVSWPSAVGSTAVHYDFDTTQAGQARNLATLLPLIGKQRQALGLAGFYYYTWMGDETRDNPEFDFAGLLSYSNGSVRAKPALAAFRSGVLALEGCRRKGAVATSCIR